MARPRLAVNVDNLIRAYLSGLTAKQVADRFNVKPSLVRKRLREAGVRRRAPLNLPNAEIVARYRGGWSEKAIADFYGCARSAIRPRLVRAGVTIRSPSAAETLKWSKMTGATRKRQVAAAHAASRGRRKTFTEKARMARTIEKRGLHISESERTLAAMLRVRGIDGVIPQQAIGPYNCDLGAAPVAVEVFGGEWHWSGRHLLRTPRRFRYLMKKGWHILVVHVTPRRYPLTKRAADDVAAYIQRMRRHPTLRREYRVIRGTGEAVASGCVDDKKISIVWALTLGRDSVTGRYKGVPR